MILVGTTDPFIFMNFHRKESWTDIDGNYPNIGDIIEFSDIENKKWMPAKGELNENLFPRYYEFLKFQNSLLDSEKQFGIPPFKIMYSLTMLDDGKIKAEELKENKIVTTIY